MRVVALIPARYESQRFPGKPLIDILGKTMIQRVYESVEKSKEINELCVLTDNTKIFKHVRSFGGNVLMTSTKHTSGTERISEVIDSFDCEGIVNVQGDEPLIDYRLIDSLAKELKKKKADVISAVNKNFSFDEYKDKNVVKVIMDINSYANYFSRSPIPFFSEENFDFFYKHIGIYAYTKDKIKEFFNMKNNRYEKAEKLEQLRFIENGYKIYLVLTNYISKGVDSPEDVSYIIRLLEEKKDEQ